MFGFSQLRAFGVLSIALGVVIKRLTSFVNLAKWTRIIEIVMGICLVIIIFSHVAIVS